MVDISKIRLERLVLHQVGNKSKDEGIKVSDTEYPLQDAQLYELLMKYYLNPFKTDEVYQFTHDTDLAFNEIYNYCKAIFEEPQSLIEQSVNILKHLYEQSNHANIKSGELQVAYFSECVVDDEITEAVGIFKTEQKENFIQFEHQTGISLGYSQGVSVKSLDKGCLVINTDGEWGFKVLMVNKSSAETTYWRDDFLRITRFSDDAYRTQLYLQMCQQFSQDVIAPAHENKKAQIEFMNKSVAYFKEKDTFNEAEFVKNVIPEPEKVAKFQEYKQNFEYSRQIDDISGFQISKSAVSQAKRKIRNLVKLDNAIEIHIKDVTMVNPDCIEIGYDEKMRMPYYKIYYLKME